jgi:hypothetical protein
VGKLTASVEVLKEHLQNSQIKLEKAYQKIDSYENLLANDDTFRRRKIIKPPNTFSTLVLAYEKSYEILKDDVKMGCNAIGNDNNDSNINSDLKYNTDNKRNIGADDSNITNYNNNNNNTDSKINKRISI